MEDYEAANANEWHEVVSKSSKTSKQNVKVRNRLSHLTLGTNSQSSAKATPKIETSSKPRTRPINPSATPKAIQHSYSEAAKSYNKASQPSASVIPIKRENVSPKKNVSSHKPLSSLEDKQYPRLGESPKKATQTTRQNSASPHFLTYSSSLKEKSKSPSKRRPDIVSSRPCWGEDNSHVRSQRQTLPDTKDGTNHKYNVSFTQTRPFLAERKEHTTVANVKLPYQRRRDVFKKQQISPRRHQEEALVTDVDNLAKNDYRQRKPPTMVIPLPKFSVISCSSSNARNSPALERLRQIELYTDTCIVPSTADGTWTSVLKIWGTHEQASSAADLIQLWIREPKVERGKKWAHIPSLTEIQKEKLKKRLKREEKQNEFKKSPPEGAIFGWIGVFGWPVQEYRPDEVLGRNCEALDPIRVEYYVYITWDAAEKSFSIYGQQQDQVEAVMESLNHTFCQVIARSFAIDGMTRFFTKPLRAQRLQSKVLLLPSYPTKNDSFPAKINDARRSIQAYGPDFDEPEAAKLRKAAFTKNSRNEERIVLTLFRALERIRWFRGNLQMRVRLGSFVLSRYMKAPNDLYDLDIFKDMMEGETVKAFVGRNINNIEGCSLPSKLQQAGSILFPRGSTVGEGGKMMPIIAGTFVMSGSGGTGNLRLHVEFHETAGKYERVSMKWSRLENGKSELSEVLSLSNIDIESGLAWQYLVTASGLIGISRVPENYHSFARSIKVRAHYSSSMTPTERLLVFDSPAAFGVPLLTFEESVSWRFNMALSEYVCEVLRTQRVVMTPKNINEKSNHAARAEAAHNPIASHTLPNALKGKFRVSGAQASLHEPEWGVQVWHNNWDSLFDQNEALPIGKRTKWEPEPAAFLPLDFEPIASTAARAGTSKGKGPSTTRVSFGMDFIHSSDEDSKATSESESEQRRRLRNEKLKNRIGRQQQQQQLLQNKLQDEQGQDEEQGQQRSQKGKRDRKNPFPGSREGFQALSKRLRRLQALILDEEFYEQEYEEMTEGDEAEGGNSEDEELFDDDELYEE